MADDRSIPNANGPTPLTPVPGPTPLPTVPQRPDQLDRDLWAGAVRIVPRPAVYAPDAVGPTRFPDVRTETEALPTPEVTPIPRASPDEAPDLWENILLAAQAVEVLIPEEVIDPSPHARINLASGMPVPATQGVEMDLDVNGRVYLDPVYWSKEFSPNEVTPTGGCDCTEEPCTYLFRSTWDCGTSTWGTPVLVAGSLQTGGTETPWAVTGDPCIYERRAASGETGCPTPLACTTAYTVPFYIPILTAGGTEIVIITGFGWSAQGVAIGDYFDIALVREGQEMLSIEDKVVAVTGNPAEQTVFASTLKRFPTLVRVDRNQTLVARVTAKGPFPFTLGPLNPFNGQVSIYLEGYVLPVTDTRDNGYRGAGQGASINVARGEPPLAGAPVQEAFDPATIKALATYLQKALAPGTPR